MPPTVELIQQLLNYFGYETNIVPAMLSEGTWFVYTKRAKIVVHLAGTLDTRNCVRMHDVIEFDRLISATIDSSMGRPEWAILVLS